tara:strand:+ start:449 stop:1804 length:1356 start_codon:yes stop_codon:yes gene_type:complete
MSRLWNKGYSRIIPYVYDTIPNVFTTIGILGTFLGIYLGLRNFDVENITDSIPTLLEGLKTAFMTSIWGIILALLFGRATQFVLHVTNKRKPTEFEDELTVLNQINLGLAELRESNTQNFVKLNSSLVGEGDDSISTNFTKIRNQLSEIINSGDLQSKNLKNIESALGGDLETSLLTQFQKMRAEQNEYSKSNTKNVELIIDSMKHNNAIISKKFEEFSELLAKNNTEALVEVMKTATEEFNKQMSALIEKLVQENFKELNNSVQRMNEWQQNNKTMISELTSQFTKVSEDFSISSESIKEITDNTSKLTDDNSHLKQLVDALQDVMVDDTKFKEITSQVSTTVGKLESTTIAFDETTNKLNDWVRNQMNFTDSVAKLLLRLEEIDKIKDINEVFWNDTKKQLNEGVVIIENASSKLASDIDNINESFYERLNDTLQNLDNLIQRIIVQYK